MANDEHVALLRQGVDAWNAWRDQNPDIRPDLSDAYLVGAELRAAHLRDADLSGTKLMQALLCEADLRQAISDRITEWGVADEPQLRQFVIG